MRGIYETVSLSTTREDISFTVILDYIKYTSQIVDALYTHDVCYLGMLKEINNHVN